MLIISKVVLFGMILEIVTLSFRFQLRYGFRYAIIRKKTQWQLSAGIWI